MPQWSCQNSYIEDLIHIRRHEEFKDYWTRQDRTSSLAFMTWQGFVTASEFPASVNHLIISFDTKICQANKFCGHLRSFFSCKDLIFVVGETVQTYLQNIFIKIRAKTCRSDGDVLLHDCLHTEALREGFGICTALHLCTNASAISEYMRRLYPRNSSDVPRHIRRVATYY